MTAGRFSSHGLRIMAAAAIASLVGVGSALHASADVVVSAGEGFTAVGTDAAAAAGHFLNVTGQFAGANVGNTLEEAYTCVADGGPDAAAVAVTTCELNGFPATPVGLEGPASATAGQQSYDLTTLTNGLTLCMQATAIYNEGALGPITITTALTCIRPHGPAASGA